MDQAQARARVDAVLIPQRPGDPPERIHRVGAPARPVQGDHQELPGPLVGGPLAGLCQQVRHQGAVPSQREQRLGQVQPRRVPLFQQLRGKPLHDHGLGEVGQRRVLPQLQRPA